MGFEFARGANTRCPPFLVGGLMIMCLFLLCSWWSSSSQNFELLRQNDNLAEQLRINGEELKKCKDCQKRSAEQEVQMKQMKDSYEILHLQCQKQEDELNETKKKLESLLKDNDMCQTEMDSLKKVGESKGKTLDSLRAKQASLERTLEKKVEKIAELEKKIESLKESNSVMEKKMKKPIFKIMEENIKNQEQLKNSVKITQNESPPAAFGGNQEIPSPQDENNAEEVKNDDAMAEPIGDPREQAMAMNPII